MPQIMLNPCPGCGERFDLPVFRAYIENYLMGEGGGKCPTCGTQVVIEEEWRQPEPVEPLDDARTDEERRAVSVTDFPLSVKCRNRLVKMGVMKYGDLVRWSKTERAERLSEYPDYLLEIEEMIARYDSDAKG